eukprot:4565212-Pleurochrysis_carterae.AAC.1
MRATSLRVLAAIAARDKLPMRRLDFVAAYLQSELERDEVVYCRLPPGYESIGSDGRAQVCKVIKPIYGMGQAGRRWRQTLFHWLRDWGFMQCALDACVFTTEREIDGKMQIIIIGCYVDDLLTLYSDDGLGSLYKSFTSDLASRWNIDDEGPVSDLLNVDMTRDAACVLLQQHKYIADLVNTYLRMGSRRRRSSNLYISRSWGRSCTARLKLGATLRTRSACCAGQWHDPHPLCSTPPIEYSAISLIIAASDYDTLCATGSPLQATVALSSSEAEIVAATEAAKEAVYLRALLSELGTAADAPTFLSLDNKSAIDSL